MGICNSDERGVGEELYAEIKTSGGVETRRHSYWRRGVVEKLSKM